MHNNCNGVSLLFTKQSSQWKITTLWRYYKLLGSVLPSDKPLNSWTYFSNQPFVCLFTCTWSDPPPSMLQPLAIFSAVQLLIQIASLFSVLFFRSLLCPLDISNKGIMACGPNIQYNFLKSLNFCPTFHTLVYSRLLLLFWSTSFLILLW